MFVVGDLLLNVSGSDLFVFKLTWKLSCQNLPARVVLPGDSIMSSVINDNTYLLLPKLVVSKRTVINFKNM